MLEVSETWRLLNFDITRNQMELFKVSIATLLMEQQKIPCRQAMEKDLIGRNLLNDDCRTDDYFELETIGFVAKLEIS